ncbi:hypothetical protein HanXRQr2_Chr06g0239641 [Helianthus annuus]|uniref:Uncharacterized protein n=1 Tax=Helianthus annuus TaxID=4232 RepID=A0A9K3IPI2_HELAN|nr:hypothetical protein HanXRQr2_Chr06g0239641 [Helianthus annuus]KAJ0913777.1 hypothetical protein HanPSC8_Chr06g0231171 [Helianthus annuus]
MVSTCRMGVRTEATSQNCRRGENAGSRTDRLQLLVREQKPKRDSLLWPCTLVRLLQSS